MMHLFYFLQKLKTGNISEQGVAHASVVRPISTWCTLKAVFE